MAGGTQDPWHRTQDTKDAFSGIFLERFIKAEGAHSNLCSLQSVGSFSDNLEVLSLPPGRGEGGRGGRLGNKPGGRK